MSYNTKEYSLFTKKFKNNFQFVYIKNKPSNGSGGNCALYSKLALFSKKLNLLMFYFTKNDMDYLLANFSHTEYITLGAELYKLRLDPLFYPEYEQIRTALKITIELLYAFVTQYNKVKDLDKLLAKVSEQDQILGNVQMLKEKINQLQKQVNLFEEANMAMPTVEVHMEMIIYMQRYGFPENGVFDTDLLQEIVEEMNRAALADWNGETYEEETNEFVQEDNTPLPLA